MASLKETMERDLLVIQADLASPVCIINSVELPCSVGSPQDALVLEDGGFSDQPAIVLIIRKIDITDAGETMPVSQNKITYKDKVYRIASVTDSATDAFTKLVCVGKDRGV